MAIVDRSLGHPRGRSQAGSRCASAWPATPPDDHRGEHRRVPAADWAAPVTDRLQGQYRVSREHAERNEAAAKGTGSGTSKKKTGGGSLGAADRVKKRKTGGKAAAKVAGAVDIAIHSAEMTLRHHERPVVETRISRSRFQGRLRPNMPSLNVSYRDAPPALRVILKTFDTTAAQVLLDDRSHVIARKIRREGPLHAIIETLLSIHTPIPSDVAFWQSPTQLAMGHGQTAKGILRFEKQKENLAKTGGLVTVKVSGVLKAEGVIVRNLINDGTYTVTGEQTYDPRSREWRSSRWSVEIRNELANAAGLTIAQTRGRMLVESQALQGTAPTTTDAAPNAKP